MISHIYVARAEYDYGGGQYKWKTFAVPAQSSEEALAIQLDTLWGYASQGANGRDTFGWQYVFDTAKGQWVLARQV